LKILLLLALAQTAEEPTLVPPLSIQKASEPEKEHGESLLDALTKGTPSIALRYRYESVDDASGTEGHASTLRSVLGYRTRPYRGFSFFVQAQNVATIGTSETNAVTDPPLTRMQQVYGRFEKFDTTIDLGRREIGYGDHRFVGDVSWRQNHQAFDALHLSNRSLPRTTLSYTFASRVLRVNGGEKDMSSHFLNAVVALRPAISLELFSYLLDYDQEVDAALDSQSYGGKLSGSHPFSGDHRLLFEAQVAKQTDSAENPNPRNADYLHLVGGVEVAQKLTLKLGRELLGGSLERGVFKTPLATLFKFNGWADKFLTTPPSGLIDWYVSGEGKLRSLGWVLAYHDFRSAEGSDRYGSELDARAVFSTSWKQSFGFQLAFYREDGLSTDTGKLWLWTEFAF
jgi:hypothetical protein